MRFACCRDGCDRPAKVKGMCRNHYTAAWNRENQIWKKYRSVMIDYSSLPVDLQTRAEMAFWRRIDQTSGCWLWTRSPGAKVRYGVVSIPGYSIYAHRMSYELARGQIPQGMLVDHECRAPNCVNPEHLRLANKSQNAQNVGLSASNESGYRGVSWHTQTGQWQVHVRSNGVRYYGGRFDSFEDAARAARDLRNRVQTHNADDRGTA